MLSFLLKQSRRKGFTVVELVVVIAIIGIMAAIAIPVLSAGRNRGETGNAYAKSYYYAMQDIMVNYERSGGVGFFNLNTPPDLLNMKNTIDKFNFDTSGFEFLFVTEVSDHTCTDVKMYFGSEDGFNGLNTFCAEAVLNTTVTPGGAGDSGGRAQKNDAQLYTNILKRLNEIMPDDTADGFLYAYMDTSYRIQFAYWSDADLNQLRTQDTKTQQTGNNIVGMYVFGAYPKSRSIYVDTAGTENLFDAEL